MTTDNTSERAEFEAWAANWGFMNEQHSYAAWEAWQARAALATQSEAVPVGWVKAVQEAYGWLWHINNEPLAPVLVLPEGKAAYQARQALRDLLTTPQRGEAINAVAANIDNIRATALAGKGE